MIHSDPPFTIAPREMPVVNVRKVHLQRDGYESFIEWAADPNHIYIGRNMTLYVPGAKGSKWANPFPVKKYGREKSLEMYEQHILETPALRAALPELRGKTLGCWCHPEPCHGDVLLRLVDSLETPKKTKGKVKTTASFVSPEDKSTISSAPVKSMPLLCGATTTVGTPCQRRVKSKGERCSAHRDAPSAHTAAKPKKGSATKKGCYKASETAAAYIARVTTALRAVAARETQKGEWSLWAIDESFDGSVMYPAYVKSTLIYAPGPAAALLASGEHSDIIEDSITEGNDVLKWVQEFAYAKHVLPFKVYTPAK